MSGSSVDIAESRRRVGFAIRRLGHAVVGHHATVDDLDSLADMLEEQIAVFDSGATRDRSIKRPDADWGPVPDDGAEMFSFDERPVSGQAAPHGLDVRIFRDGDEAVGRVTLGPAHEGAPGRSHGGLVSALFDDVFGFVLTIEQQAAFTGTLTVRYEHGTPIDRPLECRVRLDEQSGRKLLMSGELRDVEADLVVARSTAIFIAIDQDAFGSAASR